MSSHPLETAATVAARKPITLHRLRELYAAGEKLTMLTCYDASFARVADDAGSNAAGGRFAGMVLQGPASTLPVTLGTWPITCVVSPLAKPTAFVIGDLPFRQLSSSRASRRWRVPPR